MPKIMTDGALADGPTSGSPVVANSSQALRFTHRLLVRVSSCSCGSSGSPGFEGAASAAPTAANMLRRSECFWFSILTKLGNSRFCGGTMVLGLVLLGVGAGPDGASAQARAALVPPRAAGAPLRDR